jgi:hypothetical protein
MTQITESRVMACGTGHNGSGIPQLISLSIQTDPGQICSLPDDESFWRTPEIVAILTDASREICSRDPIDSIDTKLQETLAAQLVISMQVNLGLHKTV